MQRDVATVGYHYVILLNGIRRPQDDMTTRSDHSGARTGNHDAARRREERGMPVYSIQLIDRDGAGFRDDNGAIGRIAGRQAADVRVQPDLARGRHHQVGRIHLRDARGIDPAVERLERHLVSHRQVTQVRHAAGEEQGGIVDSRLTDFDITTGLALRSDH